MFWCTPLSLMYTTFFYVTLNKANKITSFQDILDRNVFAASLIFFSLICLFGLFFPSVWLALILAVFLGKLKGKTEDDLLQREWEALQGIFLHFCTTSGQKLFLLVVTVTYRGKCEHWGCENQMFTDLWHHLLTAFCWLHISALPLSSLDVQIV